VLVELGDELAEFHARRFVFLDNTGVPHAIPPYHPIRFAYCDATSASTRSHRRRLDMK